MKITKKKLQNLIKEEVRLLKKELREVFQTGMPEDPGSSVGDLPTSSDPERFQHKLQQPLGDVHRFPALLDYIKVTYGGEAEQWFTNTWMTKSQADVDPAANAEWAQQKFGDKGILSKLEKALEGEEADPEYAERAKWWLHGVVTDDPQSPVKLAGIKAP